jgi:DNA mismatch repair protein MutS
LRENILMPLKDEKKIKERLDFVEEFLNDKILLDKTREKLSYISDIDAILNRLALDRVSPRDLLNLKKSLKSILEIIEIIKKD